MRLYWLYLALFLVSLLLFFVGAFTGIVPLILAGIASTVVLFMVRRWFLPDRD